MKPALKVFSEAEIEQFLTDGYVMLRGAFSREAGKTVRDEVWKLTGLAPDDSKTWKKNQIHLQKVLSGPVVEPVFTPRLFAAFDDLMGIGRWEYSPHLGWWPISFPGFEKSPWQEPQTGWHVDGQQFHHHLNSRDQGLLSIFLFSDIEPGDGGTALSLGSHHLAARILQDSEPAGLTVRELLQRVNQHPRERVIETTGEVGDVALMHPFMSHTRSANTGNRVRFICNPCFSLKEPMDFQRENPEEYSPVEQAIVDAISQPLDLPGNSERSSSQLASAFKLWRR